MANGLVLWQGPSLLDGAPIVAIAVGTSRKSANSKTGGMLQTYILRSDVAPIDAIRSGADASICGNCPLRATVPGTLAGRGCYVNVGQGPTAVWHAFKAGAYPQATNLDAIGENRAVRIGTYGDPAAVPVSVWTALISKAAKHTGYTHQWNRPQANGLKAFCMASVQTEMGALSARKAGWRTFRVATDKTLMAGEIECLSARNRKCSDCGLCNGAGKLKSIVILAHGPGRKHVNSIGG